VAGSCEHSNEPSGAIKGDTFSGHPFPRLGNYSITSQIEVRRVTDELIYRVYKEET
jgi:hypothetical protein